ncbi:MAG: NAD(P)/FAD-dependent oxidoreductase [Sinobacteraceae bacterium]|nr:NAD(P)/FAD-dependent oxidoreductase [Nevskiaceae bacterium]
MAEAEGFEFDAIVVGAGFSGLYAIHKLRSGGLKVRAYEVASDVGGVWYWNRYPGARVDVESREYSYGFSEQLENEWRWSEQYASQPELLSYARHVADRFDLRRDIQFETRVTAAHFDEESGRWAVSTDRGDRVTARFMVMASGNLSVPKDIDLPGVGNFKGELYRTAVWPQHEVTFTGKRVGVVGTGSSGIQVVPVIAQQAKHLTVFQRTPAFSLPANNRPMTQDMVRDWLDHRVEYRRRQRQSAFGLVATDLVYRKVNEVSKEECHRIFEERWGIGGFCIVGSFSDLLRDEAANNALAEFVRAKIRGIVKDPQLAEKLTPTDYPIFTKRPAVDSGFHQTFNRDNVTLVDLRCEPIETVTGKGIRAGGKDYELDMLVLALGFDAMTGALTRIDIRGRGGRRLKDEWANGPGTYLGLGVCGFPNLFLVSGPGSPSVLGNTIAGIEHNVDWIASCIAYMAQRQLRAVEPSRAAQESWMLEVRQAADSTLYPRTRSWYMGDNVAGKPRMFMVYIGGWKTYLDRCDDVAAKGYEGFVFTPRGVLTE